MWLVTKSFFTRWNLRFLNSIELAMLATLHAEKTTPGSAHLIGRFCLVINGIPAPGEATRYRPESGVARSNQSSPGDIILVKNNPDGPLFENSLGLFSFP